MKSNVEIINNFLDPILIYKLKTIVKNNLSEPVWKTNLFWDEGIVQTSSLVSVLELIHNFNDVYKEVKNLYIQKFPETKNKEYGIHLYLWHKLSYIPFHLDGQYSMASTVYLNNNWNRDHGGFFIYEKDNKYEVIKPEFNKAVINKSVPHGTTLTTADAPLRETLQVFIT
jgi:Rps23 Pro-64 3,4-dihydroxylase Tpa1-like proline 4-hydroxylase